MALLVGFIAPTTATSGNHEALLDARSRDCLGCHRASIGEISSNPNGQLVMVGSRLGNHSVGMLYEEAWRTDPRRLRPLPLLSIGIALPGGRVTCISCHLPNRGRGRVRSVRASGAGCPQTSSFTVPEPQLCTSCHTL